MVQFMGEDGTGMNQVYETFAGQMGPRWSTHLVGAGQLEPTGSSLEFVTDGAESSTYTNAQIDDYQGLPRRRFAWTPPLRLTVRARFSHAAEELQGTAGFGFWNDPLLMTEKRLPALPRAIWFFYASAPSNIKLDIDVPGHGWKVACIDAQRPSALLWAPLAPLVVPLMNIAPVYRILWPRIQRGLNIREATIPVEMTQWHVYELEWSRESSRFSVAQQGSCSGHTVLDAPSPGGPLGFVMWQDNQYLVLTPWGRIRWGLLEVPHCQCMEIASLEITPLDDSRT
jgi:hypothetical protein